MNPPNQALIVTDGESDQLGSLARARWLLDPQVTFLNHGSFGATPRAVLAAQDEWRARMERQPVDFMVNVLPGALRAAADDLATFLGGRGDDLVFVDNATSGVNAALRSIHWQEGDRIVFTNHAYGAINKAIHYVCERYRVTPVEVALPFPIESSDQAVAALEPAVAKGARLAVIDHVTSPSALVLPVERLVAVCGRHRVPVLVDGAHAPGMLPVELSRLGADYYAGNCHKWLLAPKGCGFLWASPEAQRGLHPPVISWGWPDGFTEEFDWTGTRDPSAWLAVSAAIEVYHQLPAARRRGYNNALAAWAADRMERAWEVPPSAPPVMRASMATVPLPPGKPATKEAANAVHHQLVREHRIEVPVLAFQDRLWVRVSAQAYNEPADYERLIAAVDETVFET